VLLPKKHQTEQVVYVDEQGNPTGEVAEKIDAHHANTRLHLAFSCYVFNSQGEILITKRAATKKVWPGVWTNSVCGHPGPGETMESAIIRRLRYELGMQAVNIQVLLPEYRYQTPPFKGIIENEFCPVFAAISSEAPNPNKAEVDDYAWIKWNDFILEASKDVKNVYSWWCKDQIKKLSNNKVLDSYIMS
jgi:isopentenyl-diphosphate Delta-isomerase